MTTKRSQAAQQKQASSASPNALSDLHQMQSSARNGENTVVHPGRHTPYTVTNSRCIAASCPSSVDGMRFEPVRFTAGDVG